MNNHDKLMNAVKSLSISQTWNELKEEWMYEDSFLGQKDCPCGHKNITEICTIRNLKNNNTLEIGNCCVKKFMDMKEGDTVFNTLRKLRKDIRLPLNRSNLQQLKEAKLLSEWEESFYKDTIDKRRLTEKQLSAREKINRKFCKLIDKQYKDENYVSEKEGKPTNLQQIEIDKKRNLELRIERLIARKQAIIKELSSIEIELKELKEK